MHWRQPQEQILLRYILHGGNGIDLERAHRHSLDDVL